LGKCETQGGHGAKNDIMDTLKKHLTCGFTFFIEGKDSVVIKLMTTDGKKYDTRCFFPPATTN